MLGCGVSDARGVSAWAGGRTGRVAESFESGFCGTALSVDARPGRGVSDGRGVSGRARKRSGCGAEPMARGFHGRKGSAGRWAGCAGRGP